MSFRRTETPVIVAAKARSGGATAYRIEQDHRLPLHGKAPRERRRHDPLAAVSDNEVVPLLKSRCRSAPAGHRCRKAWDRSGQEHVQSQGRTPVGRLFFAGFSSGHVGRPDLG
jgi:hypothetical protein